MVCQCLPDENKHRVCSWCYSTFAGTQWSYVTLPNMVKRICRCVLVLRTRSSRHNHRVWTHVEQSMDQSRQRVLWTHRRPCRRCSWLCRIIGGFSANLTSATSLKQLYVYYRFKSIVYVVPGWHYLLQCSHKLVLKSQRYSFLQFASHPLELAVRCL